MVIRTARLLIRPLERADVDAIYALRPHTDPLLLRYNLPAEETDADRDLWFDLRTGDPARREFAILTASGQFVGRIGLREMDGQGSARLGISIGADFVDRGYGTEALAGWLNWYFGQGGFVKLVLDVLGLNTRAIRVYDKLGFRRVSEFCREADQATLDFLAEPSSVPVRELFRRENDQVLVPFYEMELTREMWQTRNPFSSRKQVSVNEMTYG
jgi:diamine N-acetyltransferase